MRHHGFCTGKWVFIDWMGIDPGYGTAWSSDPSIAGEDQPVGLELKAHRPRTSTALWQRLGPPSTVPGLA